MKSSCTLIRLHLLLPFVFFIQSFAYYSSLSSLTLRSSNATEFVTDSSDNDKNSDRYHDILLIYEEYHHYVQKPPPVPIPELPQPSIAPFAIEPQFYSAADFSPDISYQHDYQPNLALPESKGHFGIRTRFTRSSPHPRSYPKARYTDQERKVLQQAAANDFQKYYDTNQPTLDQVFNDYELHSLPEFRKFIERLPGYEEFIENLARKIDDNENFRNNTFYISGFKQDFNKMKKV